MWNVILSDEMVDRRQVRFPRTKKKRIRKKWAKRPENWKSFPKTEIFEVDGKMVMHPTTFKAFQRITEDAERAIDKRICDGMLVDTFPGLFSRPQQFGMLSGDCISSFDRHTIPKAMKIIARGYDKIFDPTYIPRVSMYCY